MARLPQRRCVGCGRVRAQPELVRLARASDNSLVPDMLRRLPGRGAYLCPDPACAEQARRRRGFERALRGRVTIPDNLIHLAEQWQRNASTK